MWRPSLCKISTFAPVAKCLQLRHLGGRTRGGRGSRRTISPLSYRFTGGPLWLAHRCAFSVLTLPCLLNTKALTSWSCSYRPHEAELCVVLSCSGVQKKMLHLLTRNQMLQMFCCCWCCWSLFKLYATFFWIQILRNALFYEIYQHTFTCFSKNNTRWLDHVFLTKVSQTVVFLMSCPAPVTMTEQSSCSL